VSGRWFGTDGIRGKVGEEPLVPHTLARLGRALGDHAGGESVLIASDTRASGPEIVAALLRGLRAAGSPVIDLGVMPTAGLPLEVRARGAALGLVVSASHNPWKDNGIKVFGADGLKLSDESEAALESRVEALEPGEIPAGDGEAAQTEDGAAAYVSWILEGFAGLDLSGMRLAVDCAHGSASLTAPAVLRELGASVTALFDRPNGENINAACGSTHLQALAAQMSSGEHDVGLAFDGDADRVLMVDRSGRTCDGDHMLGFLGPWLAERDELPERTVVATVMSNLGLERMLAAQQIELVRTPVGDRHVLAAMRTGGYGLGGEASGHLLFPVGDHMIGDGLYTSLQLLSGLQEQGTGLSGVIDAVPRVPQVLINVPVTSRPPLDELDGMGARVAALSAEHGDDLRIVLRYSGTENLARVMIEGVDAALVDAISAELAELWKQEITRHSGEQAPSP
jgi:phosphoglucosamine mutase